jgi:hypothetical protein
MIVRAHQSTVENGMIATIRASSRGSIDHEVGAAP